jgi:hypothetical protein
MKRTIVFDFSVIFLSCFHDTRLVKIKTRNEILSDIIKDGKKHPKGWSAAFGQDNQMFSKDCFIFHPNIGVYLLKEYNKNPFEVHGVGSKLARHIDDDIEEQINKKSGDFGIIQGDIYKILHNIKKGIPPKQILTSAMEGKDLGLTIPVQGHASSSKDTFQSLKKTYPAEQKKIGSRFEKMLSDDGMYASYD